MELNGPSPPKPEPPAPPSLPLKYKRPEIVVALIVVVMTVGVAAPSVSNQEPSTELMEKSSPSRLMFSTFFTPSR